MTDLHSAVHRDGAFVLTDEERSVYTVMVYLSAESAYEGGETEFYAREDGIRVMKHKGAKGSALVFQHNVWHAVRVMFFCDT